MQRSARAPAQFKELTADRARGRQYVWVSSCLNQTRARGRQFIFYSEVSYTYNCAKLNIFSIYGYSDPPDVAPNYPDPVGKNTSGTPLHGSTTSGSTEIRQKPDIWFHWFLGGIES